MAPDQTLTREDCLYYLEDKVFSRPNHLAKPGEPESPERLGLEVEMIPVIPAKEPGSWPSPALLYGKENSVVAGLKAFCPSYNSKEIYMPIFDPKTREFGEERLYNIELPEVGRLTFEPGGQLELSSYPQEELTTLLAKISKVQGEFDHCLGKQGIRLVQLGMNPWHGVDQIGLQLMQGRYVAMNQLLSSIGKAGPEMMRLTCSIQVNLDFGKTDDTLMKRYLAAQLLAPFTTAIFANSPMQEGRLTEFSSLRARTWQHLDPSRSGIVLLRLGDSPLPQTKEGWIENYFGYVMDAKVVFIEDLRFEVPEPSISFGEWLDKGYPHNGKVIFPTLKDFTTHLSLLFSEVRPRGFMEVRSIDGQSRLLQYVPMVYYLGLLYDEKSLEKTLELLLPERSRLKEFLDKSIYGLGDPELARLAKGIMEISAEGITRLGTSFRDAKAEKTFLSFREQYTEKGRTPADDWREYVVNHGEERVQGDGGLALDLEAFRMIEDLQQMRLGL